MEFTDSDASICLSSSWRKACLIWSIITAFNEQKETFKRFAQFWSHLKKHRWWCREEISSTYHYKMVSCLKSSLEKRLSRHFSDENYIMSWSAIYVPSIKLHWYKNPEEEEEKLSNVRKSRTEILITLQSDLEDSSPQKKIDESLLFSFMTPPPLKTIIQSLFKGFARTNWDSWTLFQNGQAAHMIHLF